MIDHFTLSVANHKKSRAFYVKVLKPLGYGPKREFPEVTGFGDARKPYFWIKQATPVTSPQHIAFQAKDRKAVDAFYKTALKAGAKDDGAPGVRKQYHPNYYGAFVIAPDGHPIEAVCHLPVLKKR